MGFCFSCCRRREKQADTERQPLLRSNTDALQHADTPYEKAADVLAALHAGKLPTQQQLNTALQGLLRSSFLEVDSSGENGALDESGRRVVEDTREVVEALLQVGLEKNDDNRVQDLLYQLRELSSIPIDVESPAQLKVDSEAANQLKTAGSLLLYPNNKASLNPPITHSPASAIPSQNELAADTLALISSLRTLAKLVLTSSTFRLILGDLLLTARELVADGAEQVRRVAATVEAVSEAVEVNVRPGDEVSPPIVEETQAIRPEASHQETKSPKEAVLDRVEDIFRQAQSSPEYNAAFRTLLYVLRKYAGRVAIASTAISQATQTSSGESSIQISAPVIIPDPRFSRALDDLRVLLERFAAGKSIDPLLQLLFKIVHDVSVVPAEGDSNDVQIFFNEVGQWLDTALADPKFVNSRAGRDAASKLYDEGTNRLVQDGNLANNLQVLLDEAHAFGDAMKSDRSTNKLINALDSFHVDVLTLFGRAAQRGQQAAVHWRTTLLRTALGWILPRLLRAIRTLPMPRVEYVSAMSDGTRLAGAIDALLLSAEEALVPDVLSVQEYAEVRVEVDENVGAAELTSPNARLMTARKDADRGDLERGLVAPLLGNENVEPELESGVASSSRRRRRRTNVSATSRVRVHVEGLRVAAHDVGYYASYSWNSWLGYTDEGLLSVDIGKGQRRGEGLALDVELEMNSDSISHAGSDAVNGNADLEAAKLFRVLNVQTAIPGLALRLARSRHWILNSILLAPLAGPIGRTIGTRVLNAQVRGALEALEEVLRGIKSGADGRAANRRRELGGSETETNASDWWDATLERFSGGASDDDEGEEDEPEVHTETHTEANITGVVRTTIEQAEPDAGNEAPPPTENTLAVGLGAQILPGKAEPTSLGIDIERETPAEAAHEVAGTAREALEDVQAKVTDAQEVAQDAAMKSIQGAVQVRRTAERAEERMERQERRERKKGGWRSRAFDL